MTPRRGTPPTLSPEVEAELRRLWTADHSKAAIVAQVRARLGVELTESQVWVIARENGMKRSPNFRRAIDRTFQTERLFTAAWARWADGGRPADNVVRKVPAGTHATGGYRIGGRP